jgi:hypothetical protein
MNLSGGNGGYDVRQTARDAALAAGIGALLMACSPTIKVQAPDRPIEINLNVKIQQDVRVRIERDVEATLQSKPGVY